VACGNCPETQHATANIARRLARQGLCRRTLGVGRWIGNAGASVGGHRAPPTGASYYLRYKNAIWELKCKLSGSLLSALPAEVGMKLINFLRPNDQRRAAGISEEGSSTWAPGCAPASNASQRNLRPHFSRAAPGRLAPRQLTRCFRSSRSEKILYVGLSTARIRRPATSHPKPLIFVRFASSQVACNHAAPARVT
jgi:hypothetical protein